MSPSIDPAILRALFLEPSTTKIASHGGSGFASTFRITTTTTPSKSFFIKTSASPDAAVMFEGEHTSLNAIHAAVQSLCPRSFGWDKMESSSQARESYFLATEFLDLSGRLSGSRSKPSSAMSLAQKLAKLHTTPVPTPTGYSDPQFGFPVTTCCGDTPQPNQPYTSSWPDFFARNRLLFILDHGESRQSRDPHLRELVEKTAKVVVPRLLGPENLAPIVPVVVHGDLWSGNHSRGTIVDRHGTTDTSEPKVVGEDVVYDPSSCYAHSEYELGIMRMFGGFSPSFYRDYHELVPKTEPVEEYEDRVSLYEAYHHLNHWAIFGGGGYRDGAMRLLQMLIKAYGGGGGG